MFAIDYPSTENSIDRHRYQDTDSLTICTSKFINIIDNTIKNYNCEKSKLNSVAV
jgi:hypothetical protein